MNTTAMTETEICQNYITPAIEKGGWDRQTQIRTTSRAFWINEFNYGAADLALMLMKTPTTCRDLLVNVQLPARHAISAPEFAARPTQENPPSSHWSGMETV